ncbi:MAG: ABC transporter permease, partial [bacterium]
IGWAGDLVGGPLGMFLQGLALIERLDNFVKGVLDSGDVLYYLTVIGVFLFLTVRALDWRRW